MTIWDTLEIERTSDQTLIRRAYARKLKVTNPEDDAEAFQTLRAAYDAAMRQVGRKQTSPGKEAGAVSPKPSQAQVSPGDSSAVTVIEDPRPSAAELSREAYDKACRHLEKVMRSKTAEPDERLSALQEVLASPVLDQIAIRDAAETWLVKLIARTQPRSDPLINPVIDYFGWDKGTEDRRAYRLRQSIRQRQDDIGYLTRLRQKDHPHNAAYRLLTAPPQPQTLKSQLFPVASREQVESLLDDIASHHPTVTEDLDTDTLAMWRARLLTPGLTTHSLWLLLVSPAILIVMVLAWLAWGWNSMPILTFGGLALTGAILVAGHLYCYQWPRRWWLGNWRWRLNPWLQFGWGPAAIALPFVAILPPSVPLTALIAFAAVLTSLWAVITGEPYKHSNAAWPWQTRLLLSELFLTAWWAFILWDLPRSAVIQMTPTILVMTIVSGFGKLPVFNLWSSLAPMWQRAILWGLVVIGVANAVFLWESREAAQLRIAAVATTAAVVIMHRAPTFLTSAIAARIRYFSAYAGLLLTRLNGDSGLVFLVGGELLNGWAIVLCVNAAGHIPSQRKPGSR